MPVKHNLLEDLKLTHAQVDELRKNDSRLSILLDAYDAIDAEVLKAESNSATDDQVKKLKEKRLRTKDQVVQQIANPNPRGAARQF
jgi:uncharacterized protein YdcH (DUF465 family)